MQFFFQPNIITFIEELHSFLISLALVSRWFFSFSIKNARLCHHHIIQLIHSTGFIYLYFFAHEWYSSLQIHSKNSHLNCTLQMICIRLIVCWIQCWCFHLWVWLSVWLLCEYQWIWYFHPLKTITLSTPLRDWLAHRTFCSSPFLYTHFPFSYLSFLRALAIAFDSWVDSSDKLCVFFPFHSNDTHNSNFIE